MSLRRIWHELFGHGLPWWVMEYLDLGRMTTHVLLDARCECGRHLWDIRYMPDGDTFIEWTAG